MGRLTTRQLVSKKGRQRKVQRAGLQPGDILQDRYRIVGTLGAGGFSSVYQARDMRFPNVTKLCAVKEMLISTPDPKMRELTIKSFEREASMLATLDHAAIPKITDYFTDGDRSYLILDLVRGKDLEHWLEENKELLDQETAIEWTIQLCDALAHLHEQKPHPVVFRDVKPSNIMLDQHNRIRLIDFGIAKVFETGDKGTMIGTEGYSPPEQYRGQAEPAGDIYALGATLHHLLTRQDPRLEPPFTFIERPINKSNPHVSPAFEAIIMRCLNYDPKERYDDARELQKAMELLQEPTDVQSNRETKVVNVVSPGTETAVSEATTTTPAKAAESITPQIQPIWKFKCEDEIRGKAAIENNVLYVGAYDNNLYAIRADSGEFLWKFPTEDSIAGSTPFVYEDLLLIGSVDKHLYAITKQNGREKWKFQTGGAIYSSPNVKFDHAFVGSDDGHFYAVNVNRGQAAWKTNAYSPVRSTPYVDDERVFFGTEGGYIFCLELASGKVVWQAQAKRAVTASPAFADEILFVGSLDSTVYAFDASSGWVIWRFRTRRAIVSSPCVHEQTVYVGSSDGALYALDMDSGRQLWSYQTEGQIASSPAVANDAVYFGSTDGSIYCLGTKKGKLRWKFETEHPIIASPIVVDGVVYIGSTDHHMYALPA